MRYALVLLAIVALVSLSAEAQSTAKNPLLASLPFGDPFAATLDQNAPIFPARLPVNPVTPITSEFGTLPHNLSASSAPNVTLDPSQQVVLNVHPQYSWQAYVGYSFFRFYQTSRPDIEENQSGLNLSIVYYWKDWLGFDGELAATHGTQRGQSSWFLFGGGGPRFRWSGPPGLEFWGHALVGGSHFTPQTSFGKQESIAFEVGGGVDINLRYKRLAYRFGADMVGSRFFSTYQYSPKVFVGIVFKF